MLFDSLLGFTAFKLSDSQAQRTAFLHVDYRRSQSIDKELQVDVLASTGSRIARSSSPAGCSTATTVLWPTLTPCS